MAHKNVGNTQYGQNEDRCIELADNVLYCLLKTIPHDFTGALDSFMLSEHVADEHHISL